MKTNTELARAAGLRDCTCDGTKGCLDRLIELARADQREACAKLVDHILKEGGGTWGDAIRARGNK